MDKLMIGALQALFLFCMFLAGRLAESGVLFYLGLVAAGGLSSGSNT